MAAGAVVLDPSVLVAAPQRPSGIVFGDVNRDGFRDMAVTTDTPDKVSIDFSSAGVRRVPRSARNCRPPHPRRGCTASSR
jgi:hypothetical protein